MNRRKIAFLDLEDTVIEEFTGDLIRRGVNHARVRAFLQVEQPDEVRLFSFALRDEADVRHYRNWWQRWVDNALGIQVNLEHVFTTERLFRMCRRHGAEFADERECARFHGKSYGFQRYIEMCPAFDDAELVLVDDAVETKTITYPHRALTVRMVNVAELAPAPDEQPEARTA